MENWVKYHKENRIGYLTLNRPEKRNALNGKFVNQLQQQLELCKQDSDLRVLVLKGEGEAFCAGADLAYLQELQNNTYAENLSDSENLKQLFYTLYNFPKPVIAQVEGHAIAGGSGLATVCDFVFSVPEAKFGYTEVRIGFVPAIVSVFLLKKVGENKAKDLLLTGRLIHASEALSMGLIHQVCSAEEIAQEVNRLAKNLSKKCSGDSLALTKQLIHDIAALDFPSAFQLAAETNAKARETKDCKRGIAAFLNKEKISW